MEVTPRPNNLYRQIAKDYTPKNAEMNICKYIMSIEQEYTDRINRLDERISALEANAEEKKTRRKRKDEPSETFSDSTSDMTSESNIETVLEAAE